MSKVPFFLRKPVEVDIEGILLPELNSLTVTEQTMLVSGKENSLSPRSFVLKVAGVIAKNEGISTNKASTFITTSPEEQTEEKKLESIINSLYSQLQPVLKPGQTEKKITGLLEEFVKEIFAEEKRKQNDLHVVIRDKYSQEINVLYEKLEEVFLKQKVDAVTILMRRAYPLMKKNLDRMKEEGGSLEDIKTYEEFVKIVKDWGPEDTGKLDDKVFTSLWNFLQKEQGIVVTTEDTPVAKEEKKADETDETDDEKKILTGQKSIGSSSDTGPPIQDLIA